MPKKSNIITQGDKMTELTLQYKSYVIRVTPRGARNIDPQGNIVNTISWYCSYIENVNMPEAEGIHSSDFKVTYSDNGDVGFDTAHMYNDTMSADEKKQDAIRQAKAFIDKVLTAKESVL